VDYSLLMGMVIMAAFHAKDFWAYLGADFTAYAAIRVNSWHARHIETPGIKCEGILTKTR
jgi:hypothetical protein